MGVNQRRTDFLIAEVRDDDTGHGSIVVLCKSKFDTLLELDEHIERVHTRDLGLRSLPTAVRVDGTGIQLVQQQVDVIARPVAATGAGAVPAATTIMECSSRKTPHLLLTALLKDKGSIIKTESTDSIEQVGNKWLAMANRLSTDYGIFDTNGYVKNDHWGNVVRILETFMSGIKNAFSVMQGFARMDSGDLNIFGCTHKKSSLSHSNRQVGQTGLGTGLGPDT